LPERPHQVDCLEPGEGFYVADDGAGIPDEEKTDVLEHGYLTGDGGTGFGLSIVLDIADSHGWSLRVADSVDGGARFEFTGVEFHDADASVVAW